MIVSAARRVSLSILAISLMVFAVIAQGADGTWTSTAAGNWSTASNWSGGIVANGPAFTANFNTIDPAADLTVTLDGNRSIGNLIFGDSNTATAACNSADASSK